MTTDRITFPYVVPARGEIRVECPRDQVVIFRAVKPGDVFCVSPEGVLHHNHDEVCPFHGLFDRVEFIARNT